MNPRLASAHASLLSALPADGVTIFAAPESFRLEFNEPVSPLVMRLVRPDGRIMALANPTARNNAVTIVAPPMSQQGTYVLSWRVISADGHPVGGVVSFSLGHPTAGVNAPAVEGAASVHVAIWAAQFILWIGLFVGVGGAVFATWLAAKPPPARAILAAVMIAGIVAAMASLPFQGLDALAEPPAQAWRPAIWVAGFENSWGSTVAIAVAALAAGLVALRLGDGAAAKGVAGLALAGTGLALAVSGHASTAEARLTVPAVFLHGICVAFWVGSLLPLAMTVRAGDRVALERFSRLIPAPLVVLIVTGVALAAANFDRLDTLWTTDYGLVLAGKLAVVAVMLALAALNRYTLVPRLAPDRVRRLTAVIATEFVLAIVILGIVGLWRFTPPPRALAAAEATFIHFHGERAMAQMQLTPQRDRGATLDIAVTDDDFKPVAAKEVAIVLWNPSAGIEPIRTGARFIGGAQWRASGLRIAVAGVWRMRVEILVSDFDKIMLEDNAELPRVP